MVDRIDQHADLQITLTAVKMFRVNACHNVLHSMVVALAGIFAVTSPGIAAPPDFAHDIAPILRDHCGQCHIGKTKKGGLSFNTRGCA